MIINSPAVMDRTVHAEKLRIDLNTATFNAEQHGISLTDIVLTLLQRADDLTRLAIERGADLTSIRDFFGYDK